MTTAPFASIIVPAHQAAALLPDTLAAIEASRKAAGGDWELVVVDDGSRDGTDAVAQRFADRVIRLEPPSGGPSRARNAGVAAARGSWLLFIDADVRVHADTLRRFRDAVSAHPEATAVFGSYDAAPAAPGLVSQYRNLLHRYFHVLGAGQAETFWAGLGGVRADGFRSAGGFDAARHPRRIEDIELGYRLRDAGAQIILDPTIQGTHLKRWSLGLMVVTDFRERGLPWMRLVLERRRLHRATLNMDWKEGVRVSLAGSALVLFGLAVPARSPALAAVGLILLGVVVAMNLPVYRWFAGQKGWAFAVAVVPLHLWYYLSNAVAAGLGLMAHLVRRLSPAPKPSHA